MCDGKTLIAAGLLFGATALNAHANLTSYNGNGNVGLVYSSVSNITWTQDANLLGTLESTLGYTNVVDAIIAASPSITDIANFYDTPSYIGHHTVSVSDFSAGGYVNWFGAQAFVSYLNSINYGGSTQWRLPSAGSNPQYGYNQTGSELGKLFYSELGGTADDTITNTSIFDNEKAYLYWSGTEYAPDPSNAWLFNTSFGYQGYGYKDFQVFAWAVSPEQVAAVSLPDAVWLMSSGLLGLLSLKRHKYAG